ncbi:hypothetical protein FRB98_003681 [Tulasnella sp. 332]|nr:hypothetical protein FRB98_003681 [Tulasnella sp. 332]
MRLATLPNRGKSLGRVMYVGEERYVVMLSPSPMEPNAPTVRLTSSVAPTINIDEEVGPSFDQHTWARLKSASLIRASRPSADVAVSKTFPLLHVLPKVQSSGPSQTFSSVISTTPLPAIIDSSAAQEDMENSDNERNFANEDGTLTSHLENKMQKLTLDKGPSMDRRFHGKSSGLMLLQAALDIKAEVTGMPNRGAQGFSTGAVRSKYWRPSPWEWIASFLPSIDSLRFPPPDLIRTLIDRCFDDVLVMMPVIHRPSFEKQYAEERHRIDFDFAKLLLIVCSVGARYCSDPRVCLTSPEGEVEWNSAGWVYFAQVYQVQKPLLASAKLIDLQIMALAATFLQGTSAPYGAWLITGIGLRFALDIGAHREKVYSADHAFENQLWKRAFWCLVMMDQLFSAIFGRPLCICDEEIDAHLPMEVDDDGWDDATRSWIQSAGKVNIKYYLKHLSLLMDILTHAVKTIYSINKSKIHQGFIGSEWEQRTGKWLDGIPNHLKWDPQMHSDFYREAASLRIAFYHVQIFIHRPFIQPSSKSKRISALSHPSLAICTNAARSSAHILDATMEMPPPPIFPTGALVAGVVLMISIWEARRYGPNVDVSMQIAGVRTCLRYLKKWERLYHFCGKQYDVLRETASSVVDIEDTTSQLDTAPPMMSSAYGQYGQPTRTYEHERNGNLAPIISHSTPTLSTSSTHESSPSNTTLFAGSSSQYVSPVTNTNDEVLDQGLPAMHSQPSFALRRSNAPSMQWDTAPAPPMDMDKSSGTQLDAIWEDYHIAGSGMPGLGTSYQRLQGYATQPSSNDTMDPMSPNSFLDGLIGASGQAIGGSTPVLMGPGYWDHEPTAQWNWMTDIPGMFGASSVAPNSRQ